MSAARGAALAREVRIATEGGEIGATLGIPQGARGLVIFAHGSGSSRRSLRNRFVAEAIERGGFATLLIDLLTQGEDRIDRESGRLRFDIALLAGRLVTATRAARAWEETRALALGYFGASTGAAAAIVAAAACHGQIGAIVSRGGRPDLAGDALGGLDVPTLFIVGGADEVVLGLHQSALAQIRAEKELVTIPGATHLFEEPGALEEVARLATGWFARHLA